MLWNTQVPFWGKHNKLYCNNNDVFSCHLLLVHSKQILRLKILLNLLYLLKDLSFKQPISCHIKPSQAKSSLAKLNQVIIITTSQKIYKENCPLLLWHCSIGEWKIKIFHAPENKGNWMAAEIFADLHVYTCKQEHSFVLGHIKQYRKERPNHHFTVHLEKHFSFSQNIPQTVKAHVEYTRTPL